MCVCVCVVAGYVCVCVCVVAVYTHVVQNWYGMIVCVLCVSRSILSYLDEVEVSSDVITSRPAPKTTGGLSPSASTHSAVVDRCASFLSPTPPLSALFSMLL